MKAPVGTAILLLLATAGLVGPACGRAEQPPYAQVVVLEGDAYQRGLQHGRALSSRIRSLYTMLLETNLMPYLNREQDDVMNFLTVYQQPEYQEGRFSYRMLLESGQHLLEQLEQTHPEFVEEMAEFWTAFVSQTLDPILRLAPPDHVIISEDMAYKCHSMISPQMVRRFLMPAWRTWIAALKAANPECVVEMDCDGYIAELLPLWVEAGFDACSPVEVAAGNDIVAYRRRYGRTMAFRGGIDKRALAKGGEVMRQELLRVVPPLLEEGGFIPGCDHGVPPDISWPNFVAYARLLARLTGWL